MAMDPRKIKKLKGPSPARPLEFPIRGRSISIPLDEPKPTPRKISPSSGNVKTTKNSPGPAPVSFGSARKYREDLKKVKVSPSEGRVIDSANRSEGGDGMKKGGMMKKATKAGRAMTKKSADTMGRAMVKKAGGGKCYAKGGTASARADGVAKKGKTKGKMLAAGGMTLSNVPRSQRLTLSNVPSAAPAPSSGRTAPSSGRTAPATGAAPSRGMTLASTAPAKRGLTLGRKKGGKC